MMKNTAQRQSEHTTAAVSDRDVALVAGSNGVLGNRQGATENTS